MVTYYTLNCVFAEDTLKTIFFDFECRKLCKEDGISYYLMEGRISYIEKHDNGVTIVNATERTISDILQTISGNYNTIQTEEDKEGYRFLVNSRGESIIISKQSLEISKYHFEKKHKLVTKAAKKFSKTSFKIK